MFITIITSVTVKKCLVKVIINQTIFGTLDISKDTHEYVTKCIFKCPGKPMDSSRKGYEAHQYV